MRRVMRVQMMNCCQFTKRFIISSFLFKMLFHMTKFAYIKLHISLEVERLLLYIVLFTRLLVACQLPYIFVKNSIDGLFRSV